MKRDKIVNNLTERLCSNAKSAVPIVDVFCLQAKLLPGRYNLYGNSLEFQVKYIEKKNGLQFFYFVGILFQNWIPLKGFVWCEYCKHICQDWEFSILETKLIQTRNIQRKSFAGPLDPKKQKIFEQVSIQRVALLKFPFSMQIAKKAFSL